MQLAALQQAVQDLKLQTRDVEREALTLKALLDCNTNTVASVQAVHAKPEYLDLEDCVPLDMTFLNGLPHIFMSNDALRRISFEEDSSLKGALFRTMAERLQRYDADPSNEEAREALVSVIVHGNALWSRWCAEVPTRDSLLDL